MPHLERAGEAHDKGALGDAGHAGGGDTGIERGRIDRVADDVDPRGLGPCPAQVIGHLPRHGGQRVGTGQYLGLDGARFGLADERPELGLFDQQRRIHLGHDRHAELARRAATRRRPERIAFVDQVKRPVAMEREQPRLDRLGLRHGGAFLFRAVGAGRGRRHLFNPQAAVRPIAPACGHGAHFVPQLAEGPDHFLDVDRGALGPEDRDAAIGA